MKHLKRYYFKAALLIVMLIFSATRMVAEERILYISSYEPGSQRVSPNLEAFVEYINHNVDNARVMVESMNCNGMKDIMEWRSRMTSILEKYMSPALRPDVVILTGRESVSTFLSLDNERFKRIPVIIGSCGSAIVTLPEDGVDLRDWEPQLKHLRKDFNDYNLVGGVLTRFSVEKNIRLAQSLIPHKNKFLFISDNSLGGVTLKALARKDATFFKGIKMEYLDGRKVTYEEMIKCVKNLDSSTNVLLGSWRLDCNNSFNFSRASDKLHQYNPNIPVFSITGIGLDEWAVGGLFPEFSGNYEKIGELCKDYLRARTSQGWLYAPEHYVFDHNQMNVLNILKNQLPKESIIRNEPVPFVEKHSEVVAYILVASGFLAFGFLVALFFIVKLNHLKKVLRKKNQQLEWALDKAEESNRMKSAFLANMSHEIRTPLNAIVGFSELLTTGSDSLSEEEKKHFSGIIDQNSQALLHLINDVLDLSKIETGRISLNLKQCDIISLCRSTIESVQMTCNKPINFEFICKEKEVKFVTDEARLRQVLVNLLTNSVKFSEHGTISIALHIDTLVNIASFEVTDQGTGVRKEDAERIFERFVKLNAFVQGTGLGLQICRQIIELLGGKIWLDTQYQEGAKFRFIHPMNLDTGEEINYK